jgi:SAM-dependent methyltransferase
MVISPKHRLFQPLARLSRVRLRVRARALYAIPKRWRGRVVSVLPDAFRLEEMRRDFWDRFYDGRNPDPFGFDGSLEEAMKFDRTLALCGDGPFDRALEVGCSVGTFTEALAPRCGALLAVDIAPDAARRAADRLAAATHVTCEARDLSKEFPVGPFDLIVVSDVLYYWTVEEIKTAFRRAEDTLAPGGRLVAMHYVPRMGSLLDGGEVHDILASASRLPHTLSTVEEFGEGRPYRVDCYERPAEAGA